MTLIVLIDLGDVWQCRNEGHHYTRDQRQSALQENIENGIRAVRTELTSGWHFITQRTDYINEQYNDAKSKVLWTVDYLNEPQNLLPRTGAIAAGGLTGFLLAVRGGIIRKFFFTTIGAGAVASVCYPHQAEQLSQDVLRQARRGYNISYNFVKGVKPGEEVNTDHVSKFPKSLEDIKFLIYDLYDEAKGAIFPPK